MIRRLRKVFIVIVIVSCTITYFLYFPSPITIPTILFTPGGWSITALTSWMEGQRERMRERGEGVSEREREREREREERERDFKERLHLY